ncbi:hypothetical protein BN1708_016923, partial [Verticillium longisporum]
MFKQDADKKATDDDLAFADSDSDLGSLSGSDEGSEDEFDEDEEGDFDDEDMEDMDSDEEAAALKWKENMSSRAKKLHGKKRSYHTPDLARFMYDDSMTPEQVLKRWRGDDDDEEEDIEASDDEDFFKKTTQEKEDNAEDRSIPLALAGFPGKAKTGFETLSPALVLTGTVANVQVDFTQGLAQRLFQRTRPIACDPEVDGFEASLFGSRQKGDAIRITDFAETQLAFSVMFDNLVASGQNTHDGPSVGLDRGHTDGSQKANLAADARN